MTTSQRRGILMSIIVSGGVLLVLILFAAVLATATSSARSSATAERVSRDFAEYRTVTEKRADKASAEREELNDEVRILAQQNKKLTGQVDDLTKLLRRYGIAAPVSPSDATTSSPRAASARPSKSSAGATSPSKPSTTRPTTKPTPTTSGDDSLSVCLPLVGCLL